MPFSRGQSGNPKGRPKQSAGQKEERAKFQALLKEATVPALESILDIAGDKQSKDCFNACKYIIDKAYGANASLLLDSEAEPLAITIIRRDANGSSMHLNNDSCDDEWDT